MSYGAIQVHAQMIALLEQYNHPDSHHMVGWWILQQVTGLSRAQLVNCCQITPEQKDQAIGLIMRMVHERIPLAYLLGSVPFGQLVLDIEPPVLIPRPETEEWVTDIINNYGMGFPRVSEPSFILDVCTGSGCIALSLARAWPQAQVVAVDICAKACQLARRNADINSIYTVEIVAQDIRKDWHAGWAIPATGYDIITANPPYVSAYEWAHLAPEITRWESKRAHVAHDGGYALIDVILRNALRWLAPSGLLCIEIGWQQADELVRRAHAYGFTYVAVRKDSAQRDRLLVVSRDISQNKGHV